MSNEIGFDLEAARRIAARRGTRTSAAAVVLIDGDVAVASGLARPNADGEYRGSGVPVSPMCTAMSGRTAGAGPEDERGRHAVVGRYLERAGTAFECHALLQRAPGCCPATSTATVSSIAMTWR